MLPRYIIKPHLQNPTNPKIRKPKKQDHHLLPRYRIEPHPQNPINQKVKNSCVTARSNLQFYFANIGSNKKNKKTQNTKKKFKKK